MMKIVIRLAFAPNTGSSINSRKISGISRDMASSHDSERRV